MIINAFNGQAGPHATTLAQQQADFTAEGAPPPLNGVHAAALPAVLAVPRPNDGTVSGDSEAMLRALAARLRDAVSVAMAQQPPGAVVALHAVVLECVDALDRLEASHLAPYRPMAAPVSATVAPN